MAEEEKNVCNLVGLNCHDFGLVQNVNDKEPGDDPFYINVGQYPVTSLCLIETQLWCACGNNVHILHAEYVPP